MSICYIPFNIHSKSDKFPNKNFVRWQDTVNISFTALGFYIISFRSYTCVGAVIHIVEATGVVCDWNSPQFLRHCFLDLKMGWKRSPFTEISLSKAKKSWWESNMASGQWLGFCISREIVDNGARWYYYYIHYRARYHRYSKVRSFKSWCVTMVSPCKYVWSKVRSEGTFF